MIRLRSQKLMSGVSTLAVLASFGMADPLLAAGTDVNGPGNVPAINTQTTNDLDYLDIDTNANVGATGGNSILNNAGTILGNTAGISLRIDDSVLQGAITNNGSIGSTTADAIDITNSTIGGGLFNNGLLTADGAGAIAIDINGNSIFNGGITNTGTATADASVISINSGIFTGGIVNSGRLISANGSGIYINNGVDFSGGINNSGTIDASSSGIDIDADSFAGGVTNSGLITTATSTALYWSGGVFTGGINNSGTIVTGDTSGFAVYIGGDSFAGGIVNSGSILAEAGASAIAIDIDAGLVQGGINNTATGTISGSGTGIYFGGDLFQGGLTNSGLITSQNNALEFSTGEFQGGINNTATGTIVGDDYAIEVVNDTFLGGITNAGLIQSVSNTAISINNSLFEGGINNSGTIQSASTAISINSTTFNGGITNSGLITSDSSHYAIEISGDTFNGGIVNSGSIYADTSYAIYFNGTTFNGGINNTATGVIEAADSYAVYLSGTSFNGGVTNAGVIHAQASTALYVNNTTFSGGINNSGTIVADTGGYGIYTSNTSFTGGINNSGTIQGGQSYSGLYIDDTTFAGGVTNSGLIASGSTGDYGVYVGADSFSGGINNTATGTIAGADDYALYISGTTFQGGITNAGLIQSDPTDGYGIYISNTTFSGGINNTATGTIAADSYGIYVSNTTFEGGITNAGLITSADTYGIYISNTTFTGGINNSGTIEALNYTGIGISNTTFVGGLTNSGLIDAGTSGVNVSVTNWTGGFNNTATGVIRTLESTGVNLSVTNWQGDFTNDGTILAATDGTLVNNYGTGVYMNVTNFSGNFVNNGLISGGADSGTGVYMFGALFDGDVTNTGTIISTGGYDGLGLNHTLYTGDVTNSGTILTAAGGNGIYVGSSTTIAGALTNSGLIDPDYGIYVDGAVQGGIFNSGTILATVAGIDLTTANTTDPLAVAPLGGHTITQTAGLIQGNSALDGTGTVEIALNMDQSGTEFDDTFNANGGAMDGDIVGGGGDDIEVAGNFSYLRGTASDIDQLTVTSGVGVFGSSGVTVNGDGVTFTSLEDMVVNGGVAHLDDDTTINITDDLTMGPAGTLSFLVTTNEAVHGLVAAGDDANLDGTLQVAIDPSSFAVAALDTYTYDNIITGQTFGSFDAATTTSLFWLADETVNANDVDVTINRVDFGDVLDQLGLIQTQNQQAVGNTLEEIFQWVQVNGPVGNEFDDLFVALFGTSDPAEVLAMYNEISGAEHAQVQQSILHASMLFNTIVGEQTDRTLLTLDGARFANMGAQRYASAATIMANDASTASVGGSNGLNRGASGASVWARGFGEWTNTDGDVEAPGYEGDSTGLAGGVDFALGSNATLGGAVVYSNTDVDFDSPGDDAEFDSWQVGLYGNYGFGHFYGAGSASYAWHDVSTVRTIQLPVPGAPFTALAGYDASAWSVAGELGGIWPLGRVNVQPSIGLAYTGADTDGFTETGNAGAYTLDVSSTDADSFAGILALRASGLWTMGQTRVVPDIKVGWRHEFNDDRQTFTALYLGDPTETPFTIVSSEVQQDAALVSAGLTFGLTNNLELFGDINGLYSSDSASTNASGGVRLTW